MWYSRPPGPAGPRSISADRWPGWREATRTRSRKPASKAPHLDGGTRRVTTTPTDSPRGTALTARQEGLPGFAHLEPQQFGILHLAPVGRPQPPVRGNEEHHLVAGRAS